MIHRALMGSFERFIGILIEHYAGEFPVWLAPVQAIVLPIADRHVDYAARGRRRALEAGFRVEVDERTESVGRKIRDAELRKIPYMLVVGDREAEADDGRRAPPPRGRPGRAVARGVRAKLAHRVVRGPVGIRAPRVTPSPRRPCLGCASSGVTGSVGRSALTLMRDSHNAEPVYTSRR